MIGLPRRGPCKRAALATGLALLSAAVWTVPGHAQTSQSRLDQIERQLAASSADAEGGDHDLTVQLIAIKTRALKCPVERRASPALPTAASVALGSVSQPGSPSDLLAVRGKTCAAQIEQADRLLRQLRENKRAALVARLSVRDEGLFGLLDQIGREPPPNLGGLFVARSPSPPTTAWGWLGLVLLSGLGWLIGRRLGVRAEAAIAQGEVPRRVGWRWPGWIVALVLVPYLAWLEHQVVSAGAATSWLTGIVYFAAALLTADRLLRMWSAHRLAGRERRALNIMLAHRSRWLLFAFALGQLFRLVTRGQDAAAFDLVGLCLRTLALIAAAGLVSVIVGAPFRADGSWFRRGALIVGFGAFLVLDWQGHHALAQFLIQGAAGSVVCILVYATFNRIADALFAGADESGLTIWGAWGIRPLPGLRHAVWLRLIMVLAAIVLLLSGLMAVWGFRETAQALLTDKLVNGLDISGVRVIPMRFVNATVLLVILLIAARLLRRGAFGRWLNNSELDPGAREAILRTTEYGGLAIAVLASFSWTGIGLQNTALIAGALSVGLGFGLQGLLANVVAGGTLLLERSVRPGDWIELTEEDGSRTQGRVKCVRARATEVQTLTQADVIVPNTTLVSRPLTNHTLRNTQGRLILAFEVPQGPPADALMQEILRRVSDHAGLVRDGPAAPTIQLRSIHGGQLHFQLQASVEDFWRRETIESELNLILYRTLTDFVRTSGADVEARS